MLFLNYGIIKLGAWRTPTDHTNSTMMLKIIKESLNMLPSYVMATLAGPNPEICQLQ
jgi:hypothetical protein